MSLATSVYSLPQNEQRICEVPVFFVGIAWLPFCQV